MADMNLKLVNVVDTSGRSDTSIGVAVMDDKGRFGFVDDRDERPYLPAGGERVLENQSVTDTLIFKDHEWGEHIRIKETVRSKQARESAEAEEENGIEQMQEASKKADNSEALVTKSEGIEKDQVFEPAAGDTKTLVPEAVQKKFIQDGNKFYFKGSPDKLAFRDTGTSLKTKIDGEAVVDSMITIAKNRGWSEIKVTGTESFKKDVWQEATKQGIAVRGYTPSKTEVAAMERQGFDIPKQGQSHAPEAEIKTDREKAAEALKNLSASEAVKKHPELAPYVAAVSAIEKKLATEKLSESNKKAILDRVRQNAVNSYNEGITPKMQLKERQPRKEVTAQAEMSR